MLRPRHWARAFRAYPQHGWPGTARHEHCLGHAGPSTPAWHRTFGPYRPKPSTTCAKAQRHTLGHVAGRVATRPHLVPSLARLPRAPATATARPPCHSHWAPTLTSAAPPRPKHSSYSLRTWWRSLTNSCAWPM